MKAIKRIQSTDTWILERLMLTPPFVLRMMYSFQNSLCMLELIFMPEICKTHILMQTGIIFGGSACCLSGCNRQTVYMNEAMVPSMKTEAAFICSIMLSEEY